MSISFYLTKFAKGKEQYNQTQKGSNAVIYTRVSSKEQAETNKSLDTQKKYCLEYASKNSLRILGIFGGTYESAKSDERKEFNRMIKFVKAQRERISFILVFSLDRFSRTGDNAIFISSELKKYGISIVAVTQPIDVSTHAGVLQQNIQFIFSKYDNDLRREKSITGMREKLLRGEWTGAIPIGYTYQLIRGTKVIVPNEQAKFVKKAFEMKAQGSSNTEIAIRLNKLGLSIDMKRLTDMLRNPLYCGYLSNNMLEGKLIKGIHEPVISEKLFISANEALKKNAYGYKQYTKNNRIPLKNYVRCSTCGTPFTAYLVKAKKLYYYKCNKIGCKCNRSAIRMHELFRQFLKQYQIDKEISPLLKEQLLISFDYLNKSNDELKSVNKQKLTQLKKKLDLLEERFALGEITNEIFDKVGGKIMSEIDEISDTFFDSTKKLSNPEKFVAHALKICENLSDLWDSLDFDQRVKLQELIFPGGLLYDRQIDNYRTLQVNQVLTLINTFSKDYKQKKTGQADKKIDLSGLVPKAGIEPAHLSVHDFESCASTSSAT